MATTCPHCQAENPDGCSFCEKCGKALPSAGSSGPRVVDGQAVAATQVGRGLQSDQLRKVAGKATACLFAVAVLHVLGGILFFAMLRGMPDTPPETATTALVVNVVLAAVYAGLGFWARANPLPPAIVGLALFVTVHLVDGIVDPTALVRGWLVKVIVVIVLVRAIQAGVKHRRLAAETPPGQAG